MPEITALQADDWRPSSLFGKMKIAFCSSKLFIYQCQHCSQNDPRVKEKRYREILFFVTYGIQFFHMFLTFQCAFMQALIKLKAGSQTRQEPLVYVFVVCLLLSVVELCAVCTQFSQRACGLHTELVNSGRVSEITQDLVSSR